MTRLFRPGTSTAETPEQTPPPDLIDATLEAEENEESRPPDGELIEFHCTVHTEAYLPSHAAALFDGMHELGWDRTDHSAGYPLVEWVREAREKGLAGGYANVGHLVRKSRGGGGLIREVDLPEGVDHAQAQFWSVTPALTVLAVLFVFTDDAATALDRVLRRDFTTRVVPTDHGWAIHGPGNEKRRAVEDARRALRRRCSDWFEAHLPGAFAAGLFGGDWPTVDVLTAEAFEPLTDIKRVGIWDYRELLQLIGTFDTRSSPQVDGLRLRMPFRQDESAQVITLAGRKQDLFGEQLASYGGGDSRWGFANWLTHRIEDIAVAWACIQLLGGYHAVIASARDRRPLGRDEPEATVEAVRSLRRTLLPHAWDAEALAAELEALCKIKRAMPFGGLDWAHVDTQHPDHRTLGEAWRERCSYQAAVLARTGRQLRETVSTDTEMGVAAANLALQHQVAILTRVSIAIAIVAGRRSSCRSDGGAVRVSGASSHLGRNALAADQV